MRRLPDQRVPDTADLNDIIGLAQFDIFDRKRCAPRVEIIVGAVERHQLGCH
jgi:hypothetical protein